MSDNWDKARYSKIILRNAATLLILDIFMFIAVTLVNLLPAIYDVIQADFGLSSPTPIMVMEAFFVISGAGVSIYWGYLIDKVDRKKILFLGVIIWICGTIICTFASSFPVFVSGRMVTAAGIGVQMPSVYSIMADIVPARYWSTLYASLALLMAICNAFGNFLSGFISPMNIWGLGWKFPFALFSIASIILFFLLWLLHLPNRGSGDPWIGDKIRSGAIAYNYTIKKADLKPLWKIATNRYMLYLCFFAVIPGATLGSFLIYYFNTGPFSSFPAVIRTPISSIFSGMVGVGYLLGTLDLGTSLFDWLHTRHPQARAQFTFCGLIIGLPLLIAAFLCIVNVDYTALALNIDPYNTSFNIDKYVTLVSAIFLAHPSFIAYFFLIFFGSMVIAPITINRTPTLLEVNLPEHMGTSQAILNFSDQIGKGFTLLFLAFEYTLFSWIFTSVNGLYLIMASVVFYIFPILWWRKISMVILADIENKKKILLQRTS